MCNTNGTTIGVQREQLSAVETNYFHFIDLARLKLLSYPELIKKKNLTGVSSLPLSCLKLHNF